MSNREAIRALRAAIVQAGSLNKWAAANRVSSAYVSDALNGKRNVGPKLREALTRKVSR